MRTHAHLWFLGLLTGLVLLGVATIPAAAQPRTPVKIAVPSEPRPMSTKPTICGRTTPRKPTP